MSTPAERLITKPFVLVTLAAGAFFLYVGMMVPLLPRFIEDELGQAEAAVGLSLASFALAAIAVRPLMGPLADRFGRRALMMAGALLAAVACLVSGHVDSLGAFIALRCVAGIGEASLFVGAATMIADLAPEDRRAEGASYFSVAIFAGIGIGPIISEALLGRDRFVVAFTGAAVVAGLGAVLAAFVPAAMARARAIDDDRPDPAVVRWHHRVVHPGALDAGLVLGTACGAFAVFSAFLPDHATDVGLGGSAALFATYSAVCLTLRLVGARVPARFGPVRTVCGALSALGASLFLLAAVPEPWALWASAALAGVGMAFMYPSLMAFAVDSTDERGRARVMASFTMFFDLGAAVGGLGLGVLAEMVSKRAAFAAGVVLIALSVTLLFQRVAPIARARRLGPVAVEPRLPIGEPLLVPSAGD